jgi:gamma-glutamyltranspeptidase / glutathione hydrolase
MNPTRPTIYGSRHAISAGHYLAAAAGFAVLEAGGNAIDAGCAAGMALSVVQCDRVNFAGVAPIMIRTASGHTETIDGLGHWPRGIPADLFMREHGGKMPIGILRTVIPAAPDSWITALARHGTMGFADVAAASIHLARDGFVACEDIVSVIASAAAAYACWPANAAVYLPGGKLPEIGSRFVQSDLAKTITYMADQERGAASLGRAAGLEAARAAFYAGDIAREIAAYHAREGGYLTMADLGEFRCRIEAPVRRTWRGHDVIVCGPWCQGPSLLESLLLVEQVGLDGLRHNSADYLHVLAECLKLALADREYHFGDPQFIDVPIDNLLSPGRIARRAAQMHRGRACPEMPPPLDGDAPTLRRLKARVPTAEVDTSYVCVVDRWGNAFSSTPSDPGSTSPMIPGLGIVPSSRGSQSLPDPRHPAGVAPGKRPRLTPNPAMVVTRDGGVMPFGTPGGDVQIQAMLQVLLNVLHFGMDVQSAIEAPRIASFSFPSSFAPYEYYPGRLAVETRIDADTREDLARRGHDVQDWPEWTRLAGSVEVIRQLPATGLLAAGADPRRPAYAMAI